MIGLIEKQIKKYLKKHLTAHPKNYYFLRWLAECVKRKGNTLDVVGSLASYFYHKQNELKYSSIFDWMQFTDIFVIDDEVYICTTKPGMWIGKGGETFNSVEHKLNYNLNEEKINNYHIHLIEDLNSPEAYMREVIKIMMDDY